MKDRKTIESAFDKVIQEHFDAYSLDGRRSISPTSSLLLAQKLAGIMGVVQEPKTRIPKIKFSVEDALTASEEIKGIIEDAEAKVQDVCEELLSERGSQPASAIEIINVWAQYHSISPFDKISTELNQLQDFFELADDFRMNGRASFGKAWPLSAGCVPSTSFVRDLAKSDLSIWVENGSLHWEAAEEEKSDRPTRKKKISKKKISRRIVLTKDE